MTVRRPEDAAQEAGRRLGAQLENALLRELCSKTLHETHFPELGELYRGKVRDSYVAADGKRRFIVVSDRVSCFDVVVGTLPFKGGPIQSPDRARHRMDLCKYRPVRAS